MYHDGDCQHQYENKSSAYRKPWGPSSRISGISPGVDFQIKGSKVAILS
jgi:hypothetical protein